MSKIRFYSHLIQIDSLIIELDKLDISQDEKIYLSQLVDSSIDHKVLDSILNELSEEDKRVFLKHLAHDEHSKIWDHLHDKIEGIEEKIQKAAEELKKDLHKDIKEAKSNG